MGTPEEAGRLRLLRKVRSRGGRDHAPQRALSRDRTPCGGGVPERGQRFELETEITSYVPNEALQARITSKGFETLSTYRLQEEGGGLAQLTSVLESRYTMLLPRLIAPLVTRQAQKKLEADLDRLKRPVEA